MASCGFEISSKPTYPTHEYSHMATTPTLAVESVSRRRKYTNTRTSFSNLSRQRRDHPRRPIIFIAHSLGGIVLKQALGLCHSETVGSKNDFRDILVSTHAVLFFGTPHFGVKGVELLQTMNRLLSVHLKTTKVIVRNLKENSSALDNIQRLYTSASKEIETVLFYEIVPYNSATIAGDRQAIERGLDADHCEMVKFPNSGHANYATVLSYLKQHVEGATAGVAKKWCTEDAYRDLANREDRSPNEVVLPKPSLTVSRNYIDRPRIQSLITQHLFPSSLVRRQPWCILHGIGGAGKTQLATKWIRDNENKFTRVIFVDASSQTQLEKDLGLSVHCLGPEYSKMTWKEAVAYLDGKETGWLLFFDNADSPDLNLRPYLPNSIHGTILITTRNSECSGYAPDGAIPVGNLEESEAVELLHVIANVAPQSNVQSLEIVRELGMLALAITQAGTYIRKTRRLDTYLDTFRKHHDRPLRKKLEIGSEYTSSTYTAFDLSFDCLHTKAQSS
ncbi:SubName: Full=Related to tetratricopeptide repeat domain protein-Neosartorya fischeri {ECO:0000313/EMBL:CCA75073.1} [Serendipita indica DSM 11827]|nr:SubName: Full=Related to tetratricopeptide repeat domain protein-Neosartorya fischeri {ECO:0000313/EMBL:CCA75073.1} [Serendipita indica DSM 11827]